MCKRQKSEFVGFPPLNVTLNTGGKKAQGCFCVFHLLTLDDLSCRAQPTHSFSGAFNSCAKLNCAQNSNNFNHFPRACGCSACLWEVQHRPCLGHRRVPRQAGWGFFWCLFPPLLLRGNSAACRKQAYYCAFTPLLCDMVWVTLMYLKVLLTPSSDGGSLIHINLCREGGCIYL